MLQPFICPKVLVRNPAGELRRFTGPASAVGEAKLPSMTDAMVLFFLIESFGPHKMAKGLQLRD